MGEVTNHFSVQDTKRNGLTIRILIQVLRNHLDVSLLLHHLRTIHSKVDMGAEREEVTGLLGDIS